MEKRLAKLSINGAGGTASIGSKTYKITIPSKWVSEMGLGEDNRNLELIFDGNSIKVTPLLSVDDFVQQKLELGHDMRKITYYNRKAVCSIIFADFSDKTLKSENYTDNIVKTAFGNNHLPTWTDFENFLAERCIPKERSGIREYLETIGVDEYNPIEIIKRTEGRMAEDEQWLKVEVVR